MEAAKKSGGHMTSAAAFVDGGVQKACDDACSICLEDFSHSDPSTVTNCKHEFHLQCILEWCQRSSNCPMCWQSISLKDETSQQLLEAMKQERKLRSNRSRNATAFYHSTLGEFDLQHLAMGASDIDLEEHIFQRLAAAAAMRRGHQILQGEGQRNSSSSQGHRPFFVFSSSNAPHNIAVSTSGNPVRGGNQLATVSLGSASMLHSNDPDVQVPVSSCPPQTDPVPIHRVGSNVALANQQRNLSETRSFASQSSPGSQDTSESSDLHSLSESIRSQFNAWSMRFKESISRNTRGWKERLFARSISMADLGSEVRREMNAGIASVSRIIERLDSRASHASGSGDMGRSNMNTSENRAAEMNDRKISASCATGSASD